MTSADISGIILQVVLNTTFIESCFPDLFFYSVSPVSFPSLSLSSETLLWLGLDGKIKTGKNVWRSCLLL